jgi:release factor glutamine methyltransferase
MCAARKSEPTGIASRTALDIRGVLREAVSRLRAAQVPSYTLAAELLLMHTLGCDKTWIYTNSEAPIQNEAAEKYFALVTRRAAGEPTQYLTGKQEFWGLEFAVTPAVLIPRPETEHVVEIALARLGSRGIKIRLDTGEPSAPLRIADVGTGSGCVAVALAYELPHAEIFATDISASALDVARGNAAHHGVSDRIHFFETDLLDAVSRDPRITSADSSGFDLIVSNPPYVAGNTAGTLAREVRDHEPNAALFGGPTGVEMYARLIEQAGPLLRRGGILVLELGYDSAEHVRAVLAAQSRWANITITNDLAGIPRVIAAVVV